MARFLSREEWPLIAAGVLAGLLTAALVLYFFITGIGGGGEYDEELASDTSAAVSQERRDAREAAAAGGPVIGAREEAVHARLRGMQVRATALTGPLTITARQIVWNEARGARFARADLARGSLRVEDLERGDIVIDNVVLQRPVVALRESSGGSWNFEQVFDDLLNGHGSNGDPRPARRRTVQLSDVRIENAEVNVTRPNQQLAFQRVQARLPLIVLSRQGVPAPYLRAASVRAQMVLPASETRVDVALADGLFSFPDGTVRFDVESATLDRTRFASLDGVWDPADPGYGVTATGRALDVNFEDVRFALPESFPRTGTASFAWEVRPLSANRTHVQLTQLNARTGESRMLGDVTMILGGERVELVGADLRVDPLELRLVEGFTGPLPYGGTLTGTIRGSGGDIRFDLIANLTAETVDRPFTTGVSGSARLAGGEFLLQQLNLDLQRVPLAALRAVAPGLPLDGVVTGRVSLTGPPGRSPLAVDIRLEMGNGVALMAGTLDLTGAIPTYDLNGRLVGIDLQQVLTTDVPPVQLTASFAIEGSGTDPATMNAGLRLSGRFSGWETTPADTVNFVGRISSGTLAIQSLVATLATAALKAQGDWRFTAPEGGAVGYALSVSSLRPFGPYLPLPGDTAGAAGSLQTSGLLSGTFARPRIAGEVAGRGLAIAGWSAAELDGTYDVTLGGDLPRALVYVTAKTLETPTAGRYREGTARLELTPPGLAFVLNAQRSDGGFVEVVGNGELIENGPRRVVIERARFDLANDRWSLLRPTEIRWTDGGPIYVQNLELVAERSEGRVVIDGRVLPLTDLDARVQIAALPVGDLQRLAGQPVRLDGLLWAEGTVRGGETDARVDLTFRVDSAAIQEVPLRQVQGRIVHANNETQLDATLVIDTAGRLDLVARLPSRLRLGSDPDFRLIDGVPLSGSLTANQFALAPLAVWSPDVRDVTGLVDARVTLAGTADQPLVNGDFRLTGGSVRVPALNQRYTEIVGDVGFDGRRLVIRDMRMRSEGWLVVGGQVVLERLTEPVLDLTFSLDAFQPIGVPDFSDAEWTGEMTLRGPPEALVLAGEVEVADGYFAIPEFMGGGPQANRELIDITSPATVGGRPVDDMPATDWATNLRIDNLIVHVEEDAWFATEQARVQLTGDLTVTKVGDATPIVGTLQGNRGQYTLIAGPIIRRFDIVSAQVRFVGTPEPNPIVDITARRIVLDQSGRQFDVDVRITGTLDNPTLALAGGQPGEVAESELLSFLLFGQPSFALGGGEDLVPGEQLLTQTYLGAFWEVAALELERELGGLGLDIFQVRLGQGPLGGIGSPTFVLGRQISSELFLTVEMGVSALLDNSNTSTNTWAMRLDWAFDRRSRLRLALEPVIRGRTLRSSGLALPLSPPKQQLLLEVRRRWTY